MTTSSGPSRRLHSGRRDGRSQSQLTGQLDFQPVNHRIGLDGLVSLIAGGYTRRPQRRSYHERNAMESLRGFNGEVMHRHSLACFSLRRPRPSGPLRHRVQDPFFSGDYSSFLFLPRYALSVHGTLTSTYCVRYHCAGAPGDATLT